MTIINRALHKAYKRRLDSDPAGTPESRPEGIVTGWVSKLREPIQPVGGPESAAVSVRAPATKPMAPPAPQSVPAPARRSNSAPPAALKPDVRIDAPHASAAKVKQPDARLAGAAEFPRIQHGQEWSWPPIVQSLLAGQVGTEIRQLAAKLKKLASDRELRCVALSGPGRNAGRTSLLLTLAHALSVDQAARVAMVDADFGNPGAAHMIALNPRAGLWDAVCKRETEAAAMTTLIDGRLTIVPLVARVPIEAIDRGKVSAIQTFLRSLRREHEVVLVDAGPWESLVPPLVFESRAIDALISVCRYSASAQDEPDDENYRQPGIEWLGTIETFVP
ncbi:MAG TPA: hypothetical protein VKU82_01240 [Planctomycetaceae bacterium]|nr:hypothetical protein [Planctomycetaceae bacterium]